GSATLPAPLSLTPPTLAPVVPLIPGTTAISPTTAPSTTAATSTTTATSTTATPTATTPATTGSTVVLRGTAARPSALVRVPSSGAADSDVSVVNTTNLSPNAATLL